MKIILHTVRVEKHTTSILGLGINVLSATFSTLPP